MQPLFLVITSILGAITMLIKEKKSQKLKIFDILSIKKTVVKVKYLAINNFINHLANIVGFIFL